MDEAITASPYRLPVPPTTSVTGDLTAIWMDPGGQEAGYVELPHFAWVWASDLRFYVGPTGLTEEEVLAGWERHIAEGGREHVLTVVGNPAIGREAVGDGSSALVILDGGLFLSFIGEVQTLDELIALAEGITYP